jgi:hypothetical protein
MPSQILTTLQNQRDPKTVLEEIIDTIKEAERKANIPEPLKKLFNEQNKGLARNWGEIRGDIEDISIRELDGQPAILVQLGYEDYCRSCYMGHETCEVLIPDVLIEAYEMREDFWGGDYEGDTPDDVISRFTDLITQDIAQRIAALQVQYTAKETAKQDEARAAREAVESRERALLEELQAKYPPSSVVG